MKNIKTFEGFLDMSRKNKKSRLTNEDFYYIEPEQIIKGELNNFSKLDVELENGEELYSTRSFRKEEFISNGRFLKSKSIQNGVPFFKGDGEELEFETTGSNMLRISADNKDLVLKLFNQKFGTKYKKIEINK